MPPGSSSVLKSCGLPRSARTSACGISSLTLFMALANSARVRGGSLGGWAIAVEACAAATATVNTKKRIPAMTFFSLALQSSRLIKAKLTIRIIPRCTRPGQSPPRSCCALVATNTLVAPVGAFGIRWRGGELDDADISGTVERRRSQLPKPKGFALPSGYAPSPGAALSAPNFQMKNQGGKFSVTPVSRDVCAEKPHVSERTIPGVVAFWRILRAQSPKADHRPALTPGNLAAERSKPVHGRVLPIAFAPSIVLDSI